MAGAHKQTDIVRTKLTQLRGEIHDRPSSSKLWVELNLSLVFGNEVFPALRMNASSFHEILFKAIKNWPNDLQAHSQVNESA